uniref:RING-type domain-containing protein n=1 Tax=Glossina pallidipes TaxID=7398 RepID=A0A1B0A2T7_GLOPL
MKLPTGVCCSICMENFDSNNNVCSTSCGHVFHNNCLLQWKENSSLCPNCRESSLENVQKIYLTFDHNTKEGVTLINELYGKVETFEIKIKDLQEQYVLSETTVRNLQKVNDDLSSKIATLKSSMANFDKQMVIQKSDGNHHYSNSLYVHNYFRGILFLKQEDVINNLVIGLAKRMNFALCPDDIVQADFLMDDLFIKFKTASIKNNFKRAFRPYQNRMKIRDIWFAIDSDLTKEPKLELGYIVI